MKYLVTGKEMKLLDDNTSQHFKIPSGILMEQAASAFVRELFLLNLTFKKVLVLCGSGNNAGDGVAIARLLNQRNIDASIYLCLHSKRSDLMEKQLEAYQAYGYSVLDDLSEETLSQYDLIIDGIFGTGLTRVIEGEVADCLKLVNASMATRIAIDIPSGISSDDGQVLGCAFMADYTITFSFEKIGHFLYPGTEYCGKVIRTDIGITLDSAIDFKPRLYYLEEEDLRFDIPRRSGNTHKGSFGKLLIIAGSFNMAGAAILSAKSAYRSGCGLVKVCTAEENRVIMQTALPEAILSTYKDKIDFEQLKEDIHWADAILIGPGLSTSKMAHELLESVLSYTTVPVVLDADALNIVAEDTDILMRPHLDMILTPHLGEMSRLINMPIPYIEKHFCESAREFAEKYNVICHMKSARSITAIPYGASALNIYGNSGMSTAGSGDVLSGIIASLLASGLSAEKAASYGAFLHAKAGDKAAELQNKTSMMASDIVEGLSQLAYLD